MHNMEEKIAKKLCSVNPFLFSFTFFLASIFVQTVDLTMTHQNDTTIPINVGVVLDMESRIGKMGLNCISMALSDFYASHHHFRTRIVLNSRDSNQDVVIAAAAALDLLKNVEVQAILGPVSSMQAEFIVHLGQKAQVPIISFSATSPFLSSVASPYFIRATQDDSYQVKALSSIVQAFGWREIVPIYVDNEFGEGIIPSLIDALCEINTRVPYRSVIPPSATDDQIVGELHKLMTMQTSVFVVHMLPTLGLRLFAKAKQIGMMTEGYAWITTSAITAELNLFDPSVFDTMQGVIGLSPHVPKSAELENFTQRWRLNFQQKNPVIVNPQLDVFGLWAYDSAKALAMTVEKAVVSRIGVQKSNISGNATDLETFGVSTQGPMLLEALLNTSFRGLSGDFNLTGGQLKTPAYQIVNVIGNGAKDVAFWTKGSGIVRKLSSTDVNIHSRTAKSNFGVIIWPGDTVTPPKGWVKKLRVGVPVKNGFNEPVKVTINSDNSTTVTGYCIDIFDAVMSSLPYYVPYEYIPFRGDYNDLVDQVYFGNFDAVAGDVTIIANRSLYVDFSMPYTESGISMVVPIQQNPNKNAWVFVKPLTWDLWLTSFVFFVVIGVLIWILEHRINEDFRGPPGHQIGSSFWFSFSTMVFSHKATIINNLSRFVLIIWFLVVFILTQSYTASLTSMLTVQQLQPTVTYANDLIKSKAYVGYQDGSFVSNLLIGMGFDKLRLVGYNSVDELHQLFTKGNENGRIAAAFDEVPYMRLFLARYCSQYTMGQPTYITDGFGFVFPMGSPLIPDVSRAVLNITEGGQKVKIEKKWSNCQDSIAPTSSTSLGMREFSGLFLIVGTAVILAFIVYLTLFLYEHWDIAKDPNCSLWEKTVHLAKQFDSKDLRSHTFRKPEIRVAAADGHDGERNEIWPHPTSPPSRVTSQLQASPSSNVASRSNFLSPVISPLQASPSANVAPRPSFSSPAISTLPASPSASVATTPTFSNPTEVNVSKEQVITFQDDVVVELTTTPEHTRTG